MAKMQLIDAVALSERVIDSKFDNHHLMYEAARMHFHEHDHFLRMIQSAPVVDAVEVVHGRLVPSIAKVDCTCSVCGTEFDNILSKALERWSYCPNCGARMDL